MAGKLGRQKESVSSQIKPALQSLKTFGGWIFLSLKLSLFLSVRHRHKAPFTFSDLLLRSVSASIYEFPLEKDWMGVSRDLSGSAEVCRSTLICTDDIFLLHSSLRPSRTKKNPSGINTLHLSSSSTSNSSFLSSLFLHIHIFPPLSISISILSLHHLLMHACTHAATHARSMP